MRGFNGIVVCTIAAALAALPTAAHAAPRSNADLQSETVATTNGSGQLVAYPTNTIKLRSDETWATNLSWITATGLAKVSMATVMADTTYSKTGSARADTSISGITNYVGARSWMEDGTDQTSTQYYYPQGLTMTDTNTTGVGSHDIILGEKGVVSNVDHHSRIAIFDSSTGKYHTVLLVRPTASGAFGHFASHVGGVVQIGNYLYAGDFAAAGAATQKIAVFDLTKIYTVNASSSCVSKVGALSSVSPPFCGYGERWVLPVMNTYYFQNTDGTTPLPMLDGLGMDNYAQSTPQLLTVEYCNGAVGSTATYPCRVGMDAYSGRVFRFAFDTTVGTDANGFAMYGKVYMDHAGNLFPSGAWLENAKACQGIAPSPAAANTFYLDCNNALVKASPNGPGSFVSSSKWVSANQGCHLDRSAGSGPWLFCAQETAGSKSFWAASVASGY
jgi:hypothetical protein